MKLLRTISTRRLLAGVLGVVIAGVAGTAIAIAAVGSGPVPQPASLASAIHAAMQGKSIAGISANVTFTNNLFAGSSIESADPLVTGASGRLWATDGHLRLELQSDNGDAQLVVNNNSYWIYDPTSQTVYEGTLQQKSSSSQGSTGGGDQALPTVAQIQQSLDRLAKHAGVSGATPTDVGGQPAYSVALTPATSAGLLGAVHLSFDANQGIPLDFAIFPRGDSTPALELRASSVSYGAVPLSDFQISPPAGSQVVHVSMPQHSTAGATTPKDRGDVSVVGKGLGSVIVAKHPAAGGAGTGSGLAGPLPLQSVSVDGVTGRELPTSLGTVLQFTRDGVGYLLAGSVTPATLLSVAKTL